MPRRPATPVLQWTDPRHRLGFDGEQAAIRFLELDGWSILAHRFRVGRSDIDLVARRGGVVAFVEVKTRTGSGFGVGRESIGWRKRQAIGRVAEVWRLRHGTTGELYRFDVLEVLRHRARKPSIRHIEDAWRLGR